MFHSISKQMIPKKRVFPSFLIHLRCSLSNSKKGGLKAPVDAPVNTTSSFPPMELIHLKLCQSKRTLYFLQVKIDISLPGAAHDSQQTITKFSQLHVLNVVNAEVNFQRLSCTCRQGWGHNPSCGNWLGRPP